MNGTTSFLNYPKKNNTGTASKPGEFNRVVWCAQASAPFASDMVDGYFNRAVPFEFWKLLALYISNNAIASIPWAIPFGKEKVRKMLDQILDIRIWYDDMRQIVPSWYLQDAL